MQGQADPGTSEENTGGSPDATGVPTALTHEDPTSGHLVESSDARQAGALELRASHQSRISYFMYFRIIALTVVTVLILILNPRYPSDSYGVLYDQLTWTALFIAYAVNVLFAWFLPRVRNLSSFSWLQTSFDIVLASVIVQLSGGTTSGAVFLFPVAIVGSAIMGNREQTIAATGGCLLIFTTASVLHYAGIAIPLTIAGEVVLEDLREFWIAYVVTAGATLSVGALSVYLNGQLVRFERQVSRLGALTDDMVRSLTSILITVDTDGRIVFANAAALSLMERPAVLGERIEEMLPALADLPADEAGPRRARVDVEHPSSDRPVLLDGVCCPLRDGEEQLLGFVYSFEDVTELSEMRKTLERSERLAAIGSLSASVAHEVRNPLAAIAGCAELLDDANEAERARLSRVIQRESSRLAVIVDNLLNYTSAREPQRQRLDVRRLLSEVTEAISREHDLASRSIDVRVDPGPPVWTDADPAQMSQVAWNLVRNAVEASSEGGVVHLRTSETSQHVRIEFVDEGAGIHESELPRLFQPFFSTKPKGSGFGLAIVSRIVEDHDGTVDVISRAGEGTTFIVRLPRTPRTTAEEVPPPSRPA